MSHKLKFRKLCASWVPKMLTEEHKLKRQASTLDFLTRYGEEGDNFLSRSHGTRHGCHTKPPNLSSSPWIGGTLHRQQRQSSSRPLQLRRLSAQCFGTEKAFFRALGQISGPSSLLFSWYSAFSPRVKKVQCEAAHTHSCSAEKPLSARLCG